MPRKLILGTSKWGDAVPIEDSMSLMDEWYYVHNRVYIDTATNYPINGGDATALSFMEEYLKNDHTCDFHITVKIGSISRLRVPEFNLSPDFIVRTCDDVLNKLKHHVKCLMVHWDNRSDYDAILKTMSTISGYGLEIGVSGITDAESYSRVLTDLGIKVNVQCKYSHLDWYVEHIPDQYYYAYRVSEGFDDYGTGLMEACKNSKLDGILIGAKNTDQLTKSIQYAENSR